MEIEVLNFFNVTTGCSRRQHCISKCVTALCGPERWGICDDGGASGGDAGANGGPAAGVQEITVGIQPETARLPPKGWAAHLLRPVFTRAGAAE
ncbi:hypothetical protein [Arthrobacter sp. NPDC080082]|uniref:hypothetical protein n=1 Tax=unclassified Arthrobacter TaxID=235627 RepID=UPI003412E071